MSEIPINVSKTGVSEAFNRMRKSPKYEAYYFSYKFENMDNPRIKTSIHNDGRVEFTIPVHYINHTGPKLEKLLRAALDSTLDPDSTTRITKQMDREIFRNKDLKGSKTEIDVFKLNNGIVDCENILRSRRLTKGKRIVTKALPGMKKHLKVIDIRIREHMDLNVYPIANIYPHARLIYIDEDLLKNDVPDNVLGFVLYHEIGVIRSWDRKNDRFNDKSIENYIRSWRTYRNDICWLKDKGWRFKYGDREAGFWIDCPYTGGDTGRDENEDG